MLIAYWMAPCISVDRKTSDPIYIYIYIYIYCVPGKTQNMGFYRNMHNFEMVIAVSKTSHICYKPVQPNIGRLERVPKKHWMFLIVRSKGQ